MNDFWTISHSCLICKIVEMKISDNKKWHLRLSIDFLFVKRCPPFHTWMCSMDRRQKDKQHWNDLQMQQWVYWVYLVPMVLRKHTLYNIRYLSFEWICIYTNILWYELIKNNNILLKQECWPCVQVIDCWQFSDGTFYWP
jgi:hypothetical protein